MHPALLLSSSSPELPCLGLQVWVSIYPSAAQSHPLASGWWQLQGNSSVCVCQCHAIPFSRHNQQDQQAAGQPGCFSPRSSTERGFWWLELSWKWDQVVPDTAALPSSLICCCSVVEAWEWIRNSAGACGHQPWLAGMGVKFGIRGKQRLMEKVRCLPWKGAGDRLSTAALTSVALSSWAFPQHLLGAAPKPLILLLPLSRGSVLAALDSSQSPLRASTILSAL